MEETNHSTIIKWAVGIILTIGVITSGVFLYNKAKPSIDKAGSQLDTITVQMQNSEYISYDGKSLSGSEVLSVINTKATSNIAVIVKTKSNTTGSAYVGPTYNITDISNANYIEPTGNFQGSISKTANGTINSITFTQK